MLIINSNEIVSTKLGSLDVKLYMGSTRVNPVSISNATVTYDSATYNGQTLTATNVIVTLGGTILIKDVDYIISLNSGGINAGSYNLTVTGINNYKDSKVGTFVIDKANKFASFSNSYKSTLEIGDTDTLIVVAEGNPTITLSSSDTSVATVSGMTVTAVEGGTTTITAAVNWGSNYNITTISYTLTVPPKAKFGDILYSDANGNLSFTSRVLPTSEGKTPIGLCVAGEEFFGTGEKARWIALKYMSYKNPDTGALLYQFMYWGNNKNDISTINNIQSTYNGVGSVGYMDVDYYDNSSQSTRLPSVLASDGTWNISVLGAVNTYVMTDIDGKNKTNKILATATAQTTWQTDKSITNNYDANYAPAACCCWRYHTLGTNQGDWYLGASGEMCMVLAKKTDINTKLALINAVYQNDCISSLFDYNYWTSTEVSNNYAGYVDTSNARIGPNSKSNSNCVIAMLAY